MKNIYAIFFTICCFSFNNFQAQHYLYGLAYSGGDGFGAIFRTDGNGSNKQILHTFAPNTAGASPHYAKLYEASNGKLYGMTSIGGANGVGVIFEYDVSGNNYTRKINLTTSGGCNPLGSLIEASNGKLYGMTSLGGANGVGVIFEYDFNTNTYTKKIDFTTAAGASPCGALIEAANGKLYGLTRDGGANNMGVVFEYDISGNTYTKKIDLTSAGGSNPNGSLIEAANGKLYGMTFKGGANNYGVLFEYDISGNTYTKKIDLSAGNGFYPEGSLMEASNGRLYGMTRDGGSNGGGVLFEYIISSNTYSKKYEFPIPPFGPGSYPLGSLHEASNGKLYGYASDGGASNLGVIFEYDITGNTYTKKIDLISANGSIPAGALMEAANGKLYGVTSKGGKSDDGALFEYDFTGNTYTKKADFNYGVSGAFPSGSLMKASNGKLYGMTTKGGANDLGVIFEFDPISFNYVKKIDLTTAGGCVPYGALIEATNGKLYGLTNKGGTNNQGVLFEYDISSNTYTKKIDLGGGFAGHSPFGSLLEATNGKLYGMTRYGGVHGEGTIFEYDISGNILTKKVDLNTIDGSNPYGSLIQATNSKLYGLTYSGGANNLGALFEYDITGNIYTKKFDFNTLDGTYPFGSLLQAANGKLYGVTHLGGIYADGTLFEYDISGNSFAKKFDLVNVVGSNAYGSLIQAANGHLYGKTKKGGANDLGVVFQFNIGLNLYGKTSDFNGINGSFPEYGHLLEVCIKPIISGVISGNTSACISTSQTYSIVPVDNAGGYSWSLPSGWIGTSTSTIITATTSSTSGDVVLTATNVCGSSSVSLNVTINPSPTVTINNGSICIGQSFTLTPGGANTYTISGGSGVVSPTITTSYSVTGTSTAGCISQNTAVTTITVNTLPILSVNSGSICSGESFTIIPNGASTYTYSGGSNIVSPTTTTSYSVSGTSTAGCVSGTVAISTVTVINLPTISVTSGSICAGQTYTILPTGAYTYTVSGGSQLVSPSSTTSYSVTGTNSVGCVNNTPVVLTVTVHNLPSVSASSSSTVICSGETATLTGAGASTYTWSSTVNSTSMAVSPTVTTMYLLQGASIHGCSNFAAITVSVNECVGIEEISQSKTLEITLYPNPVNEIIYIDINSTTAINAGLIIFNSMGQMIKQEKLTEPKNVLNVNYLTSGIYLLKITNANKEINLRLVKE